MIGVEASRVVLILSTVSCTCSFGMLLTAPNASTIAGYRVTLSCNVTPQHSDGVIWLNPSNVPVSVGYNVTEPTRLKVVGSSVAGEYHLLIKYTLYPRDVGIWRCISLSDKSTQQTMLTILVPPALEDPEVVPKSIQVLPSDSENTAYTFTCIGHYAFPPVELNWIKEYGPDVLYSVLPPRVLMSRLSTMAVSVSLIVTAANARSQFSCMASHPTFQGRFGRKSVRFILADEDVSAQAEAQILHGDERKGVAMKKLQNNNSDVKQLDAVDQSFILLTVTIIAVCLAAGILLNKYRKKWKLDVHPHSRSKCSNNKHKLCSAEDEGDKLPAVSSYPGNQRRCCSLKCRVAAYVVFSFLLLSSLLFSFPFYVRSITVPKVDADEVLSVFAGSPLWLDCSSLVQPLESLIQVSWYHREELLYYQFWLNGRNVGYPPNSTNGFMFAARVTSQVVGQITVLPAIPNDDGVYRCSVILEDSKSEGRHSTRTKTFHVFVLMGLIVNYALLTCIAVALLSAASILILTVNHFVVWRCRDSKIARVGMNMD